ncbi:MAG: IS630 family transposase [Francisellaceae bacterium]|nr:IS630 family transposase [Francisellaceae bacterium]MBT6539857.1 IS630 family transposase [Francisellaceae bacterium]
MLYAERNDKVRRAFINKISKISPETLVYIDEAGIDKYITREHGRGPIGSRVRGESSGKRYARESFIAGEIDGEIIAPFCYTGTCDSNIFNLWLKDFLLPELNPGTTIVMDNAAIHKSNDTKTLVESHKCKILFLPAYSPDLNPIERLWSRIKSIIKKSISGFKTLANAIDHAFKSIIPFWICYI